MEECEVTDVSDLVCDAYAVSKLGQSLAAF